MRHVRIFTALLLALLWVPSTGYCLLVATFPKTFGSCCECDRPAENDGKAPLQDDSCNQCVTLESGVNLSALAPTVAPRPSWCEDDEFARMMRRIMETVSEDVAALPPPVSDWSPPPLHAALLTKAQPVRGPSPVA
jgi:hypothetical protein